MTGADDPAQPPRAATPAVEFLPPRRPAAGPVGAGPVGGRLATVRTGAGGRRTRVGVATLLALAATGTAAYVTTRPEPVARSAAAHGDAHAARRAEAGSAPVPVRTAFPAPQLAAAVGQLCTGVPHCRVTPGDPHLVHQARAALGTAIRLQSRAVGDGRALVVAATAPSGADLIAVVTRPGVRVQPTHWGIALPFGVQSQRTRHVQLVVTASGVPDALSLLSHPRVRHWLDELTSR